MHRGGAMMGASADLPRVLVVDDDEGARVSLGGVLGDEFDVVLADGAQAAETLLKEQRFGIVITDYDMPGRNGLELLDLVAAQYPGSVGLLLTGHGMHREVRAADKSGHLFGIIIKPYDPEKLLRTVRLAAVTSRLRARREVAS
jgi:two-component system, NtrC family, response regulator HupR/HoxA